MAHDTKVNSASTVGTRIVRVVEDREEGGNKRMGKRGSVLCEGGRKQEAQGAVAEKLKEENAFAKAASCPVRANSVSSCPAEQPHEIVLFHMH